MNGRVVIFRNSVEKLKFLHNVNGKIGVFKEKCVFLRKQNMFHHFLFTCVRIVLEFEIIRS